MRLTKMKRAIPVILATLTALAVAVPSFAGIHYKAVSKLEGGARRNNPGDTAVEGWVSGSKARIEFKESGNPMTKAGMYMITKDGGKTLYLVNPEDKTYVLWDVNAMLGALDGVMNGIGPMLKFEFSDPKVEKVSEEEGGSLLGLPTRHYKFRTSYTLKMKILGMGRSSDTVTDQEIWATTKLTDPGLGVWLRHDPPRTGNENFDQLIGAETEKRKVSGFPLKLVSTTTSTQKGKENVTHQSMEVTSLETKSIADSQFEIPAGYKETQMAPMEEGKREREQ
jgi:hypothetical protein